MYAHYRKRNWLGCGAQLAAPWFFAPSRVAGQLPAQRAYGLSQLRRVQHPKRTIQLHQVPRDVVQRITPRAQKHTVSSLLERSHIRRHAPPRILQRQLEQHFDRPAPLRGGQRLQHIVHAVEVERLGKGLETWLERSYAIQPKHADVFAQMAPAHHVPPPAVVDHTVWIDRTLGGLFAGAIADPDPPTLLGRLADGQQRSRVRRRPETTQRRERERALHRLDAAPQSIG